MQTDEDRDGYSECGGDCNDASPAAFPGGVELCDGVDNDCDGSVDNLPPPADVPDLRVGLAAPDVAWLTWTSAPTATAYDVVAGDLWGSFTSPTATSPRRR